jgi:hypothetical protein
MTKWHWAHLSLIMMMIAPLDLMMIIFLVQSIILAESTSNSTISFRRYLVSAGCTHNAWTKEMICPHDKPRRPLNQNNKIPLRNKPNLHPNEAPMPKKSAAKEMRPQASPQEQQQLARVVTVAPPRVGNLNAYFAANACREGERTRIHFAPEIDGSPPACQLMMGSFADAVETLVLSHERCELCIVSRLECTYELIETYNSCSWIQVGNGFQSRAASTAALITDAVRLLEARGDRTIKSRDISVFL